jgi:hypothetical protein
MHLLKAEKAVQNLDRAVIAELKNMGKPPQGVKNVM